MKSIFLSFFLVLFSSSAFSQVTIEGQITDAESKKPVGGAVITLTPQNNANILAYALADENGKFSLKYTPKVRVFLLKIRHLSYTDYSQQIVLAEDNQQAIRVAAELLPKAMVLSEVEIKEPSPIIVKKDTIIYDITHWQQTSDQTLEQVLQKMPGFIVLPNGELQYNGKPISKVLVDGKELSNSGAALMTRSIDPSKVESVELRTNEKSKKIKNSLLDSKEMLVLDIKLKEGLDKPIFGRIRATAGYQKNFLMGGYANFLRFGKKSASHFFAERDLLGNTEISIFQIRNLGNEAMAQLFELPADFESLTKREAFNTELYGFKDYTKKDLHIAGLTTKFNISPETDVFLGSYSQYDQSAIQRSSQWDYLDGVNLSKINQEQRIDAFESKNKIDFRWDTEKLKTRFDVNFVFNQHRYLNQNYENTTQNNYQFEKKEQGFELYPNLFFEYTLNKNLGFQLKTSYAYLNNHYNRKLQHNDVNFVKFLNDENGFLVNYFQQKQQSQGNTLLAEAFMQHQSKIGIVRIGAQGMQSALSTYKNAYKLSGDEETFLAQSSFTGAEKSLMFQKISPYLSHQLPLGNIHLQHRWGLGMMNYPDSSFKTRQNSLLEYNVGLSYTANVSFSLSYQQKLSTFPLASLMFGNDLLDFRNIGMTRQHDFAPQPERVASFSLNKNFNEVGLDASLAGAHGGTFNGAQYLFSSTPFIASRYQQLGIRYYLAELQLKKTFKKSALKIDFVTSFIRNDQNNINETNLQQYQIYTTRLMHELNFDYRTPRSSWGGLWKNKYSTFWFASDLSEEQTTQAMFSSNFSLNIEPIRERLNILPTVRYVRFLGAQEANFINLSCNIQYQFSRASLFLEADNLLDNTSFVKQNIQALFLGTDQQQVFARYVKLGFTLKIN